MCGQSGTSEEDRMISAKSTLIEKTLPTKSNTRLFCSHVREDGMEEFAVANGNEAVIYHHSGNLSKRYVVNFPIKQILWAVFKPGKDDRASDPSEEYFVMIGTQDILFYRTVDGYAFDYYVPFAIRSAYNVSCGLMIERNWKTEAEYKKNMADHIFVYSISHPLDELRPVIYQPADALTGWLFCWEREEVTVIGGVDDCLLVYDRANQVHRLFHVKPTSDEEVRLSSRLAPIPGAAPITRPLHSTPKFAQFPTPTVGNKVTPKDNGMTGLMPGPSSLSVRTRSMLRLTHTRTFPMDSPALSAIGTPMSQVGTSSRVDETISFRLRAMSHNSTHGMNLTKMLDRTPDNDLLYAEFSLKCIWTEPVRKDIQPDPASKAFISKSVTGLLYLNMVIESQQVLKCIRLLRTSEVPSTTGSLAAVTCRDATLLKPDDLTVVLDIDSSLVLYSGTSRVAVIVLNGVPVAPPVRLVPFVGDSFVALSDEKITRIELPPTFNEILVKELFASLISALPQEKAVKLASDWKSRGSSGRLLSGTGSVSPEFQEAFRFVLRETGIEVKNHPKLPAEKVDDVDLDPKAKQRRPKSTAAENLARVLAKGMFRPEERALFQTPVPQLEVVVNTNAPLFQHVYTILAVLHSVWEEMLLNTRRSRVRSICVYYLHAAVTAIGLTSFVEMYEKEFSDCKQLNFKLQKIGDDDLPSAHNVRNFSATSPLSLLDIAEGLLRERSISQQIHTHSPKLARVILALSVGFGRVRSLVDVHRLFGKNWLRRIDLPSTRKAEVVTAVLNHQKTAAQRCAALCRVFSVGTDEIAYFSPSLALLFGVIVRGDHTAVDLLFSRHSASQTKFPCVEEELQICRLRWLTDIRFKNAREMLDSTRPVLINTANLSASESEMRDVQETFLSGTCIRYLSQAMGRSIMDFRSMVPSPTSEFPVPELCLVARLFPSNRTCEIPVTDSIRPYRDWGDFYNGVSAALRIGSADQVKVEGEWIMTMCSHNEKLSAATCAGLLYGFGLNGHILSANLFHVHDLLAAVEDLQSIALLIGWAASMMATCDQQVYKMLTTQLPFLMGPTLLPIVIPPLIQTAAVAALGLVFTHSGHQNIVKKLVNEIGKSPQQDEVPASDRAAYKLNAGFAVGLICLGLGDEMLRSEPAFVMPQPTVIKRLLTLLDGGPRNLCVFPPSNASSVSDFVSAPPLHNQAPPILPSSSHVMEGDRVNVHLTSHPACVALGLMFLRTNNERMAARLELPQTITLLEGVRPDLLLVRTLCRNLILWDSIEPTNEWVEGQVPGVVMDYMRAALKWEDDDDILVVETEDSYWERTVDRETIAQVFLYTVTGACMSLALKYASHVDSVRRKVFDVMDFYINILLPDIMDNTSRIHNRIRGFAGQNVVSLCFNSLLTSMSMMMSGCGDLKCTRYARLWRMHDSVMSWVKNPRKHQEQLAAHQAIGMLFCGNARYGFKNDDRSIALLLIAFYPVVCHNVTDNRFYHQPLRFLWTQCVEPRLVVPVVRNSDTPVKCQLRIRLKNDGGEQICQAPYLLPHLDHIEQVEIGGDGFELIRYNLCSADERKEFEHVLRSNHGRIPLERTKLLMVPDVLLSDSDDNLDINDVFSMGESGDSSKDEEERIVRDLMGVPNPFTCADEERNFRWRGLDAIPTMRDHLRAIQLACSQSAQPSAYVSRRDIQLLCLAAEHSEEFDLLYRLEAL